MIHILVFVNINWYYVAFIRYYIGKITLWKDNFSLGAGPQNVETTGTFFACIGLDVPMHLWYHGAESVVTDEQAIGLCFAVYFAHSIWLIPI